MFGWFKKDKIKVGDILVCIDDRDWGSSKPLLQYGNKYKVLNLIHTSCSHNVLCVDFGSKFDNPLNHTVCDRCLDGIPGKGIHWARSSRFRKATPKETAEFKEEEMLDNLNKKEKIKKKLQENLETAIELEDYETAEILKKELDKQES